MRQAALHERGVLIKLLLGLTRPAIGRCDREIDPRTVKKLNLMILAAIVAGSLRLNLMAQAVPFGRAASVKNTENSLSWFLDKAQYPASIVFSRVRDQALAFIPSKTFHTYRGKKIVIVDPTPYCKRSRKGKKEREMEFIGKVKDMKSGKVRPGYLDIWAGVLLKGQLVLPLVRRLYSSAHPRQPSQNLVEESVIWQALAAVAWQAILVADRGFRRKALLVKLLTRSVDFVIRLAVKVNVLHQEQWQNILEVARALPPIGTVYWKEQKKHPIPCRAVAFRAQLRAEEDSLEEPNPEVNLVVLFALTTYIEPLILATSLPVKTLSQVQEVVNLYDYRWAIETTFENMKRDLHIDEFMVRHWQAIERLLWIGAMAYILLELWLIEARDRSRRLLADLMAFLRRCVIMGKKLSPGKLREAISLDFRDHFDLWLSAPEWAIL